MRTLAFAALLAVTAAPAASPTEPRLALTPEEGGLHVHVHKRGLFSAFAHDHDFEVTRWQARLEATAGDPSRADLTVTAAADSLRDREHGLSDEDRQKVEAQAAGPKVLDAAQSPEIVYRAEGVEVPTADASPRKGTVHGTLILRGQRHPVDVSYEAARDGDGWKVHGKGRFHQSDFGIHPFTGAGGTVGVKDEVDVTFALAVRPGA